MNKWILVPVGDSEWSLKALVPAADLAGRYDSNLTLLHAVPGNEVPQEVRKRAKTEQFLNLPEAIYDEAIADNILEMAEARPRKDDIVSINRATEHGDAAKQILEAIRREGTDVIVMGARGLSDFQGLILGSIAHKVSYASAYTVVTVR